MPMPFDGKRMIFGGFAPILDVVVEVLAWPISIGELHLVCASDKRCHGAIQGMRRDRLPPHLRSMLNLIRSLNG